MSELKRTGRWAHLITPWWQAVSTYPRQYIDHRLNYVWTFFYTIWYPFSWEVHPRMSEYGFQGNWLYRGIVNYVLGVAAYQPFRTLFTNGFWLITTLVALAFNASIYMTRRGASYSALLLASSAALYIAPLILVGVANDFRYSYWAVGASTVAIILGLSELRKPSHPYNGDRRTNV